MVLIIDDEPGMCWALETLFNAKGIRVGTALSAGEALILMGQRRFEVAFVDAKLPDMEGLELANRIRQMDPHMRIIMVSAFFYREDPSVRKALAEGVIDAFVSKPYQHDEILKAAGLNPLPHSIPGTMEWIP